MEALAHALRTFHERHEKLKHTVHTVSARDSLCQGGNSRMTHHLTTLTIPSHPAQAWRYPLPTWGRYAMGCFYASIPIVGGWYVMQWAISRSVEEIGGEQSSSLIILV